jgi:hypothetical protein
MTAPAAAAAAARRPHEVTAIETLWRNPWVRGHHLRVLVAALLYFLITQRAAYAFALQVAVAGFLIAYILNPLVDLLGAPASAAASRSRSCSCCWRRRSWSGSVLLSQVVAETARFVNLLPAALRTSARRSAW